MKNLYPRFQESYTQDELIEHFWLTNNEIVFVETFRSEINRQAVAVLLKSLNYLGFFPDGFNEVPKQVKTWLKPHEREKSSIGFIATILQIGVLPFWCSAPCV